MTIEAALYSYLSTYAGLTNLISTRIYPPDKIQLVPTDPPTAYVAYQLIDDIPVHSGIADIKLHAARWQFSCYGGGTSRYTNACAVNTQVKAALQDYSGTMGGSGGVVVQRSFLEMTTDLFDNNGILIIGRASDFIIWHEGS